VRTATAGTGQVIDQSRRAYNNVVTCALREIRQHHPGYTNNTENDKTFTTYHGYYRPLEEADILHELLVVLFLGSSHNQEQVNERPDAATASSDEFANAQANIADIQAVNA